MKAMNNTVPEIVARYVRNRHREEFVKLNPNIPEDILVVVYFRRATAGRWWYAPASRFDEESARFISPAPMNAKWYEIPVCPIKVEKITQETREKYKEILVHQILLHDERTYSQNGSNQSGLSDKLLSTIRPYR